MSTYALRSTGSPGWPIRSPPDEKACTAIGFTHRTRAFFAVHGITHILRMVTDNGASYKPPTSPPCCGPATAHHPLHT
ncbi:hypothetical protein GCM10029964_087860 [Kibdelosporangium lantanae]